MRFDGPGDGNRHVEQADYTAKLDTQLEAALGRYEERMKAGEDVDISELCRNIPEREEELRQAIEDLKRAAGRVNPSRPANRPPEGTDPLNGAAVTAASRLTQLAYHTRGGLGCVFKAEDEDIGRDVAIKVIADSRQHDEESRERFLREAEVTGRLRHPGIVPVYSRGEAVDGRPFYVMPFLDEGTLDEAINTFHEEHRNYRSNDPQFRDLLNRFIAACKTVAYAHSRGVVHRDLKPQNVMLGRYGETLVIDWGLAEKSRRDMRHRLSGEQSIQVRGSSSTSSSSGGFTPQYASPEQMDGTVEVGPLSDVYSLGAILYKLVSGTTPLRGTTLGELRRACLNGEFPPPRERNQSVPRALDGICLRAMQTAPGERFQSPEELAADVEAFLADAPVAAAPDRTVERIARLIRRQWPAVMATMAGLLLLAFAALGAALQQGRLKADARESSRSRLELAAILAAQAGGEEINRRWQRLELEATAPVIRDSVAALNADWEDETARRIPQAQLQAHMSETFIDMQVICEIKLVSLLVQGHDGRVFSRVPKADSIGGMFAYRDYFHGQGMDHPENATPPPAVGVVRSTVFMSKTTQKPHVAVSVPILGPADSSTTAQVIGRLSMTMEVGDLGLFDKLDSEVVPMLVETRNYDWEDRSSYGVVVHHPDAQLDPVLTGDVAASRLPVVAQDVLDDLLAKWQRQRGVEAGALSMAEFADPLLGLTTEAACAPVRVIGRAEQDRDTGWFVILHPRRESATN